jgi:hypothetical protein
MSALEIKKILVSILVGAVVAFFSTLCEGLLEWLQNYNFTDPSAITAALFYGLRK